MSNPDPSDMKTKALFDRALTSAQVSRMRGDYDEAARYIAQALEIDKANPDARELAADILFAKGKPEKAAAEYKRLFDEDQTRTSAEAKYAKAMLQIAEEKRQQELMRQMIENPGQFKPASPRSPWIAAAISIAPGFGHIYCGQYTKGIGLLLGSMICWFLFTLAMPDLSGYPPEMRSRIFIQSLSMFPVFFALVAVFIHIYALVDAPSVAAKIAEEEKTSK